MELWDLYDKNRNLTGETKIRGENHPNGRYHTVVYIFIENIDGKYLIQKRSKSKGGKWATTGGHPKNGMTSLNGIISEVKEEIGLDLPVDKIILINTFRDEISQAFHDVYYIKTKININDIKLQEDEVEAIKLVTKEEIFKLIEENKFLVGHGILFTRDIIKQDPDKKFKIVLN